MSASYLIAGLLPLLAGMVVYVAFSPQRAAGWRSAVLGHGSVFGLLLVSAATALGARSDTAHAWLHASPWLLGFTLIAGLVAWWRIRARALRNPLAGIVRDLPESDRSVTPLWQRVTLGVLLASLLWRALIALREIWLRPLYPWDAWTAWAVKAKTWFLLGHYVPYGSMRDWLLQAPTADLHTGVATHYPDALAWIDVWFASAAGGWIEPLINLPWLVVWIGLLFAHYGQWRALGVDRVRALFFVYVLGSLPLLTVHAAIAGYADMWIAAVFGFALLAWMRWLQQGDRAQLVLALVCAAILPTLKLEGLVWAGGFCAAVAFGAIFDAARAGLAWRRVSRHRTNRVRPAELASALVAGVAGGPLALARIDRARMAVVAGHAVVDRHRAAAVSVRVHRCKQLGQKLYGDQPARAATYAGGGELPRAAAARCASAARIDRYSASTRSADRSNVNSFCQRS
jgi:hypothetical protein